MAIILFENIWFSTCAILQYPFLLQASSFAFQCSKYVYEESDDYGLGGVPIRPQILSPDQVEYKEHDVVFTEIQETIIQAYWRHNSHQ